jgi:glycosyltransferase involved in cell wall biosynthesis
VNPYKLDSFLKAAFAELNPVATPVEGLGAPWILFFSVSDGPSRARVLTARGTSLSDAWKNGVAGLKALVGKERMEPRWLRVDHVDAIEAMTWRELRRRLVSTKRNYFRFGIALDAACRQGFLETELNANAMLYMGGDSVPCVLNEKNFLAYAKTRHGIATLDFGDDAAVWLFSARGVFVGDEDRAALRLAGPGLNLGPRRSLDKMQLPADDAGRRAIAALTPVEVEALVESGSRYLAGEIQADGRFHYGWHPCFHRPVASYNALRHASSLYALLEGWEVTRHADTKAAIDRALGHLTQHLIKRLALPSGEAAAFLVDVDDEIKLGGNAVCLLALVKYTELTGDQAHLPLLDALAAGVLHLQNPESGGFVHVLHYPSLEVKQAFRIIYYDGEAAFGLLRLYGLTRNPRWLDAVERAFAYFIDQRHEQAHDHWLSYSVNELTRHRPKREYFEFGIRNFRDHLDFVIERITTYPTLLELMMAAEEMLFRLQSDPANASLLHEVDLTKFHHALRTRAHYLLNGHFWPELAMFYAKPESIVGSFFIRHHAFRVRIDDVEHYLSGYVAYRRYLLRKGRAGHQQAPAPAAIGKQERSQDPVFKLSIIIPHYNRVALLLRCLDAIATNDYPQENYEVIVVDDCSTENLEPVLAYARLENYRVHRLGINSKGASLPRNFGIGQARGAYLLFIDSDDHITSGALRKAMGSAERGDCDLVIINKVSSRKSTLSYRLLQADVDQIELDAMGHASPLEVEDFIYGDNYITGRLMRRELIDRFSIRCPENLRVNEDLCFNRFFWLVTRSVGLLASETYFVADRGGDNLSGSGLSQEQAYEMLGWMFKSIFSKPDALIPFDKKVQVFNARAVEAGETLAGHPHYMRLLKDLYGANYLTTISKSPKLSKKARAFVGAVLC